MGKFEKEGVKIKEKSKKLHYNGKPEEGKWDGVVGYDAVVVAANGRRSCLVIVIVAVCCRCYCCYCWDRVLSESEQAFGMTALRHRTGRSSSLSSHSAPGSSHARKTLVLCFLSSSESV